jgi:UDP-N-acetylmuramate--alanine ligase
MVFQPHRYTRTKDLFNEFILVLKDVDNLILLYIYAAGEKPIKGIDSSNIKKSLEDSGFSNVELVENKDLVLKRITDSPDINTVFIFQGAGDISSISKQFEREYF